MHREENDVGASGEAGVGGDDVTWGLDGDVVADEEELPGKLSGRRGGRCVAGRLEESEVLDW